VAGVKSVGLPFNIFNTVSVSGSASIGVATFTSSVTAIQYKDNVGYQVNFTGTPFGVLQINASNDYNPQLPESGNPQGSSASGNWVTLTSVSISTASSPIGFNLNQVPFAYIQCQFISGTSSGTISGWVTSKGLG
jgi:hypothetical protein